MIGRCPWIPLTDSMYGRPEDSESIARVVSNPFHFRNNGTVKPSAIPNSHLRSGLSVVRTGFLPESEFTEIANGISASILSGVNVPAGALVAKISEVRGLKDTFGQLALCVYDDPVLAQNGVPKNDAHAIVQIAEDYSDEQIVGIKSELMDGVFSKEVILISKLPHKR